MNPSLLGDLGFQVTAVFPLSTSTAIFRALRNTTATDTGTVLTTSRTLDLSRRLEVGTTGGKPLDATVHPRTSGAPKFNSLSVAVPLELQLHDSGLNVYVTVAHKHRAALTGAGSTWDTVRTDVRRYKMGTDTDGVFHTGFVSSINAQALRRFYKANITFAFRKGSSTAAKDTTTAAQLVCNSPIFILSGGAMPQAVVPKVV